MSKITPAVANFLRTGGTWPTLWAKRSRIRQWAQRVLVRVEQDTKHYKLHRTVVLVGMMGSGKTAIGRALASQLGVPYLDSDAEIEAAAHASIAEIFERDGEAFFRDREAEVIARLLKASPCILSTGGGAYLAERNRTEISRHGVAVLLDADVDLLWERVRHKDTRPLLRTNDPRRTLEELFATRAPIYALADLRAKAHPAFSIEDMRDEVLHVLLQRPDILEEMT